MDLAPRSGFAATHTVDSTGDGADDDTSDGVCDDGSGNCTLRAAIQQANAGTGAIIKFSISGSGTQTISPETALPTITDPVFIDGYSQTGASAGTVLVELDGTSAGDDVNGLTISGKGSHVRGLAVTNFDGNGIVLQGGLGEQILAGNLIGTDSSDAADHGNGKAGVYINGAPRVVLSDNVISGNASHGVLIEGAASRPRLYQNRIGTNAAGTSDVGNTLAGVHLNNRVDGARIRDNVISGNDSHGVSVAGSASNTFIEHNRIGTAQAGDADLGNTGSGIHVSGSGRTTVAGNVIAGNDSHGISLTGSRATDTEITENHIGTTASGAALGNTGSGIHIGESSRTNRIEENTIANNGGDGVAVESSGSTRNAIRRNAIHDNTGDGIDLGGDGATTNDTGDSDTGPNNLQNYPTSISFASRGEVATVTFTLDVTSGRRYHIDFYSCDAATNGEGKELLGSALLPSASSTGQNQYIASTLRDQISRIKAPSGTHITATATESTSIRSTGSTSEFAPCVAHVALPGLDISKDYADVTEGSTATYTVALSSAPSADTDVLMYPVDSGVATVSTANDPANKLTFTPANYSQPQTVTVSGVSDDDGDNDATVISHLVRIGGSEYDTARLPVEVDDDDPPLLNLTSTTTGVTFPGAATIAVGHSVDGTFSLDEGGDATYTVALASEPAGDTTVTLESSSEAALTVSPASITFTRTGEASASDKYQWDDPQTVTLTAVADDDAFNETAVILHKATVSGKTYTMAVIRVNIADNSLPRLIFTPNSREVSVDEGSTATYSIALASDPGDGNTATVAIRLTGFYTIGDPITVNPEELTFTGGAAGNWATAQEVAVAGVADDDEFDNIAEIEHSLTIGDDSGSMPDVNVTVADGNRAPYFEEGILTVRSVPENSAASTDVGSPVTALDLNTGDTLTYTLEDDPDGEFEINSSTGQITVAAGAILDHEASPPVVRLVKVTVSDRTTGGLTDSIAVDIMVADVNEPPEIAGEASPSIDENTSVATRVAGYTAADPERGSITWSVEDTAGDPSDDFEIDTGGNLRFKSSPDHEAEDEYSITIVATDDGDPAQSGELPVTVTVADVNEPPEIAGDEALSLPENTAATTVLETYDASDPEGAASTFTWSLSGTDRGDFDIDSNTGALRFKSAPDYERPADSGGNNVYNVQVRASDNGTPALTGTLDITVTVTNVNEAPSTPTGRNAITVAENSTGNLARYSATDPDRGDTVTWGVSGTDASAFRIDSSGNLAFDGAPDYDSPADSGGDNVYNVKVDAKDESLTSSYDVAVTVTPVDEPPVVTGASTINNYDENGTGSVATYTAADPEGDTDIDWSLGGPDRGDFTITGGVLVFANPPDYDRPADSGGDNQYEVTIYATDSNNKRGELQADVIVRNVDEAPVLTGPDTVDDFPENSATSRQLGRYTATDPEGATVTLSLSGTDSGKFALASNGALTFRESPDYEDQDSYSVTVRAVAGSHTVDRAVMVNIENIEERGTVTLSAVQPQERTAFTATLADDDGPSGTTWQWYRTSSRGSAGTAITTATSPAYTPVP